MTVKYLDLIVLSSEDRLNEASNKKDSWMQHYGFLSEIGVSGLGSKRVIKQIRNQTQLAFGTVIPEQEDDLVAYVFNYYIKRDLQPPLRVPLEGFVPKEEIKEHLLEAVKEISIKLDSAGVSGMTLACLENEAELLRNRFGSYSYNVRIIYIYPP